ncbi:MAG: hypothetical protein KGL39_47505 [Patescibacteria group bacterium]|nr:hypothetical protein [Patescibacteria group bacterium]
MSSIKQKLTSLKSALDGKVENAPCYIASDRIHAYEILKNKPGICKIAVGFMGGQARSNFAGGDITGREKQTLYGVISRGRGLGTSRSDNLIYGASGGSPLFDLAEQMRDIMREIQFDPTTDERTDYIGTEEWNPGKYGIDAYEVKIWVGTQLPMGGPVQSQTVV